MTGKYEDIRREYNRKGLSVKDVKKDPFDQFGQWMNEALTAGISDATAMSLATCSSDGRPSCRIVLLKGFSAEGMSFYTNYGSQKAREMEENPNVALLFFWSELERQIRIEGRISKVSGESSDLYFSQRPRASRLSAWISPQSRIVPNRDHLEKLFLEVDSRFTGKKIPRPPFWGGYLLKPDYFEFWQGRSSRLHDRISYTKSEDKWILQRLAP